MKSRSDLRKPAPTITLQDLRDGLRRAAICVSVDPGTLPIFELLESELRKLESTCTSLDRAMLLVSKTAPHIEPQNAPQFVRQ